MKKIFIYFIAMPLSILGACVFFLSDVETSTLSQFYSGDATAANQTTIEGKIDTVDTNVDTINTNVSTVNGNTDNAYSAAFSYFSAVDEGGNRSCASQTCPSGWTKIACYGSSMQNSEIVIPFGLVWENTSDTTNYEVLQVVCGMAR